MLNDPRDGFADHNSLICALLGVMSLSDLVERLVTSRRRSEPAASECDDFVYLLLGISSLGGAVTGWVTEPATGSMTTDSPRHLTEALRFLR